VWQGAKALSHLAGDLHGAAAELEAALAFGSPRAVWCHADRRTPREMRMGGASALNVAVPNGVAGDTNELTIFQEIDLMCENRQLWCEVKAWTSLTTDQVGSPFRMPQLEYAVGVRLFAAACDLAGGCWIRTNPFIIQRCDTVDRADRAATTISRCRAVVYSCACLTHAAGGGGGRARPTWRFKSSSC
jgi:hypothetical protein